jgi:hypothetical protein
MHATIHPRSGVARYVRARQCSKATVFKPIIARSRAIVAHALPDADVLSYGALGLGGENCVRQCVSGTV